MDISKLSPLNKLTAGFGLLVLIALFLPWYGIDLGVNLPVSVDETVSAWKSLDLARFIFAIAALGAIAIQVFKAAGEAIPPQAKLAVTGLAGYSLFIALIRIFIDQAGPDKIVDVRWGAFVGLIAIAGLFASLLRSVNED